MHYNEESYHMQPQTSNLCSITPTLASYTRLSSLVTCSVLSVLDITVRGKLRCYPSNEADSEATQEDVTICSKRYISSTRYAILND